MEVKQAILHYCKYQERCHMEVRNKLYELGLTTPEVEEQIATLIETGVLSEERYAIAFARGKFRMLQWGKEKIRQQMKLKKISDYCISKALSGIGETEYRNTLNKIAYKKIEENKGVRSLAQRRAKVYRYLVQKGYERDRVSEIVNTALKK